MTEPDLLLGVGAIATYLGLSEGETLRHYESSLIPAYRRRGVLWALRSTLADHFAKETSRGERR